MSTDDTTIAAPLDRMPEWQAVLAHHAGIRDRHLRELFADDPGRAERLTAEGAGLFLDYSKHRVTDETMSLLLAVAQGRPRGGAPGGHVRRASGSTGPRIAPSSTRPSAPPPTATSSSMATTSSRTSTRCWTGWAPSR